MVIIAGLGNPEDKYTNTRHNVGFEAIDTIAQHFSFPVFKEKSACNALISEGRIDGIKTVLIKPSTYMNESGVAVKATMRNFKDQEMKLIVIHDDIDIPLGEVKIGENRGSAGHNGVRSVIQRLGNQDFTRIRIGILPTEGKPSDVENFVLQKFSKEEAQTIAELLVGLPSSIQHLI